MKKIRCMICEEKRRSSYPFDFQGKTVGICRSCLIVAGIDAYQAKGYEPHDGPLEDSAKPAASREAEDLLKVIKRLQKAVEKA